MKLGDLNPNICQLILKKKKNYWLPNLFFLSVASCNSVTVSRVYENKYIYRGGFKLHLV